MEKNSKENNEEILSGMAEPQVGPDTSGHNFNVEGSGPRQNRAQRRAFEQLIRRFKRRASREAAKKKPFPQYTVERNGLRGYFSSGYKGA